jgi:hypothetical protein
MNIDPQRPMRVLHLERDDVTATEVLNQLHAGGLTFGVRRVANRMAYFDELRQYRPDVVVAGDAVDAAAVLDIAGQYATTLPVVFYMEGDGLGGVVQGAVAQSRAERERQLAEAAARHDELRSQLDLAGQNRWARRSAEQSMQGLAVAMRLRELQAERKAG